ncbi:hypothetical protein [Streptomyces sp. NPDC095602]|uniref:lantibiotic dehydratase n=1 Tax=Streptomyces sp. NPDC095602 TaxID=3155819 RepID=UPI00332CACE6
MASGHRRHTGGGATAAQWADALDSWRKTWQCQGPVELRDDDRVLRLTLDVPAHAAILRERLDREGQAVLTEAPTEDGLGWLGSRVHEVAVPMVNIRPPAPNPLTGHLPMQRNRTLGSPPGRSWHGLGDGPPLHAPLAA